MKRRARASHFFAAALWLSLWLLFPTTSIATGNDGSFSAMTAAKVDYRHVDAHGTADDCAALMNKPAGEGHVTTATLIAAAQDAPAYCRVTGEIPSAIQFVIYLPQRWNGRLYMHGNGGNAGESLDHAPYHRLRLNAVRNGFAALFTNTGHDDAKEPGAIWANNDPAREADYGHRAVHVTAVAAKDLLRSYYRQPAHHAYFDGCSTGGRQGMMESQRYPENFDGILVGAPVFDLPDMLWQYRKNSLAVEQMPISPARLAQLGDFIRTHYDKLDGAEDGVIGDPLAIDFLPSRDLPQAVETHDGFTAAELKTLDAIYAPVMAGDHEIYPRTVVGAELIGQVYQDHDRAQARMASAWIGRVVPNDRGFIEQPVIVESWFRYLVFDPDAAQRDWRGMDPLRDGAGMDRMRGLMQAAEPNLRPFAERGGKLIIYHGWSDFGVNPLRTIQYVDQLQSMSSLRADDYLRLYLVPGMFHCSGGTNVDYFDLMTPLIDWVEGGHAPATLPASRVEQGKVTRTRPLCPHPQFARYKGQGDVNDLSSFSCVHSAP